VHIPLGLIRFLIAFFLGLILFRLSLRIGLRLWRRTGRPVYKKLSTAIGVMLWIGLFLLVFV
jgi:hypothetical protein